MPLSDSTKQLLFNRVEQCYVQAERILCCPLTRPIVLLNQRGKIAGSALLQRNTLRFHPKILSQNLEHYLCHVVAHEIAHLIVWQRYGKVAPHGRQWQQIMIDVFKLPANRTHNYNTDNLGIKSIRYQCQCSILEFSARRHNNVLKGCRYLCKRCRGELTAVLAQANLPNEITNTF